MHKEVRQVKYDSTLAVEAYRFKGVMQKFPNHFHDYYVIGFIEKGSRYLTCNNNEYIITPGDLLLLNPRDSHTCEQIDGQALDYRCINIQRETMLNTAFEITGCDHLPCFNRQVIPQCEYTPVLKELHKMIMQEQADFKKEEIFLFLLGQLISDFSSDLLKPALQSPEVSEVCKFLEAHYAESIALDDLAKLAGMSKYQLLRSFAKQQGISPYNYLETIRVDTAKKLLAQGICPADAALETGFSDQSHFSNFFKKFIGLTPKQYMNIFNENTRQK